MPRFDPRFLPPAGTGFFGTAATPAVVHTQQELADMMLAGAGARGQAVRGRRRRSGSAQAGTSDYFERLRAEGHTVDPSTGIPLYQTVRDDRGGEPTENPFAQEDPASISDRPRSLAGTEERASVSQISPGVFRPNEAFRDEARDIINSENMSAEQKSRALSALQNRAEGGRFGPMFTGQTAGQFGQSQQALEDLLLGQSRTQQGAAVDADLVRAIKQPAISPAASATQATQSLLPSPEQQAFGEALHPLSNKRAKQAAVDYMEVVKAMSAPGATRRDVDSLTQQFTQAYPEFAHVEPRPMSREQVEKLERRVQLEEHRDAAEAVGLPRWNIYGMDEKGQAQQYYTPDQFMRIQSEDRRAQFDNVRKERAYFKELLGERQRELRELVPLRDEDRPITVTDDAAWQRMQQTRQREIEAAKRELSFFRQKATGFDPRAAAEASIPTPTRPPSETPRDQAVSNGRPTIDLTEHPDPSAEISAGLRGARWAPGTVLVIGGQSAIVTEDRRHLKPAE